MISRVALAGALAISALVLVLAITKDHSVVHEAAEWSPAGQAGISAAITIAHETDAMGNTAAADDYVSPLQYSGDQALEDSSFDSVDLQLLQTAGESTSKNTHSDVSYLGQACLAACDKKQGACDYCGKGYCCRKGFADHSNGCDGKIGVSPDHHTCSPVPGITQAFVKTFAAIKTGANYASTRNHGVGATLDFGDAIAGSLAMEKTFPKELLEKPGLEKNCVTLKAYATAISHGYSDDTTNGASIENAGGPMALNVLDDILKGMAAKVPSIATCAAQYKAVMYSQTSQKAYQLRNSIAEDMLRTIDKSMKSERGILAFQDAKDMRTTGCKDDGTDINRAAECKKQLMSKAHGQFVFIDANRVGWSGKPAVFGDLSVRLTTFLRALRQVGGPDAEAVKNMAKAVHIAQIKIPPAEKKNLLGGMCSARAGVTHNVCKNLSTAVCRQRVSCKWMGPWDGNVAESEFLENVDDKTEAQAFINDELY